jgi:hypothetical protein
MEQRCYFVNSRGILKSCSFHSANPQSSCNNDNGYLINMIQSDKMFHGMSIYVCSDLLFFFVSQILPHIKHRFVLVSGDSDLTVPKEALVPDLFSILIKSSFLLKWFAQNTRVQRHPLICQLPIGLDFHTISTNPTSPWKLDEESHLPGQQELVLVNIRENMIPFHERPRQIYINYSLSNDRFEERRKALEEIPPELLQVNNDFIKRTPNWNIISNIAFVLSPCGNGLDCHRTWETLCLGAIPIVRNTFFSDMYRDLPVLIVNEWTDINQQLLDKTIEDFKHREFNYKKLALGYWVRKIQKAQ